MTFLKRGNVTERPKDIFNIIVSHISGQIFYEDAVKFFSLISSSCSAVLYSYQVLAIFGQLNCGLSVIRAGKTNESRPKRLMFFINIDFTAYNLTES